MLARARINNPGSNAMPAMAFGHASVHDSNGNDCTTTIGEAAAAVVVAVLVV